MAEPIRCESAFHAPTGFEARKPFQETLRDHIGYRVEYRDDSGRSLYYFSGIAGEFGEGLPPVKVFRLVTGQRSWLIGKERTWVIAWDTGGLCGSHALFGSPFTQHEFVGVLRESGVIAAS